MKFKIVKSSTKSTLTESTLLEDKVVKFGGQTYPKFGWCVILCGGPGSGKSSTDVPINAKTYNVDDLKVIMTGKDMDKVTINRSELDGDTMTLANGKVISLDGIDRPYDYSNKDFVALLHRELRPLSKKVKQSVFDIGSHSDPSRLPNILFDITGSDYTDFVQIVDAVKPMGYKVAVVWIMTTPTLALELNSKRSRKIARLKLLQLHRDVFNTLENMRFDKKLLGAIDDIWVVVNYKFNPKDRQSRYNFITDANVFHIKDGEYLMGTGEFPDRLLNAMANQRKDIEKYSDEIDAADDDN